MKPTAVAWRLVRESLADPVRVTLAFASTIVLGLAQLYLTWLVKEWIEGPFVSPDSQQLEPILFGAGIAVAASVVALFGSRYLVAAVNQTTLERLRNRAVERLLALEVPTARRLPSGDVMSRLLTDAALLGDFLTTVARRVVREMLVVAGALIMLFVLEWRWALALFTLVPTAAFIMARFGRAIRRWGAEARHAMGFVGTTLGEQLQGFSTIKGYQGEAHEAQRFAAANASYRRRALRAELWSGVLLSLMFLFVSIAVIGVLYFGQMQLTAGLVSQGTMVAFCLYAAQIVEPVRRLSEIHATMQTTLAAAERVYGLIDLPVPAREGEERIAGAVHGAIQFDGVLFAYRPQEPVLQGASFAVAAHERVVIVGATGAGKSTVAALLHRHYLPDAGAIRMDGIDLARLDLGDVRRAVCVVEQEPFLFSGPLVDNIRYGTWKAPGSRVQQAVRLAGLEPLVATLPRGLDSVLVEAGRDLSGGQRQRIGLARAIVRDPAVVVLDEATSAIDGQTEALMFEAMRDWISQRTVIAISHRLSTALRFPRAIVLHGGRIVGDGAPEQLLRTCAEFGELFREQADLFDVAGKAADPGSRRG